MTDHVPSGERDAIGVIVDRAAAAWLEGTLGPRASANDRRRAATSRWLGPRLAARLAVSKDEMTRARVAQNPHAPLTTVVKLAADLKLVVRFAAWTNPNCPFDLIGPDDIHAQLAHPDCPTELLTAALTERRRNSDAIKHRNLSATDRAAIMASTDRYEVGLLLENPATTHAEALDILARMPTDSYSMYRWQWADHPNAAADWLTQAAEETFAENDQGTIARIARHRATPGHILTRIVEHHAHRDYALANPSCPPQTLLAEARRTPAADPRVTEYGYQSRCRDIAVNPAADLPVLAELSGSDIRDSLLFDFTLAHARGPEHARAILTMADQWAGSLADLLTTTAAVSANPA